VGVSQNLNTSLHAQILNDLFLNNSCCSRSQGHKGYFLPVKGSQFTKSAIVRPKRFILTLTFLPKNDKQITLQILIVRLSTVALIMKSKNRQVKLSCICRLISKNAKYGTFGHISSTRDIICSMYIYFQSL
jgi:hypothetical protein